ncbi:MAG: peptidoglycan DD-metalloendopeptidase family protein [Chloroflexi bacterium]|nr:peptidoglycan DD-metalloendopeptidase family protein [Chloroflexota bacterium]
MRIGLFIFLAFLALLAVEFPALAQNTSLAPCGVVDAIDFPLDKLVQGYDDFSLYRPRFGGNHTGVDIGFDRWGEPVVAAARGRVTYADIQGWDTEKGVVIVEHTFPDGSIAYSLYGHMEQTDTILFPSVGRCVERGDVLGVVGWPSRGRPHLHYEIRDFLPNDGGPGYVTGNPLQEGWFNPLDFTALWRARLTPAFISYASFELVPSVPPVRLDNGQYVIASSNVIAGVLPPGQTLWRIEADGVVNALAALPNNRVAAHTRSGQVMVLDSGRYSAIWTVPGPELPFQVVGETLVFAAADGDLAAYDAAGNPLWMLPGDTADRITLLETNGQQIAYAVRASSGVTWRLVDAAGQVVDERKLDAPPVAAPLADESWLVLDGKTLKRLTAGENHTLATVTPPPGRAAALAADILGNTYLFVGDSGRTLLSLAADGTLRWRVTYPVAPAYLPPLMAIGRGCLLYTLDVDGMLNVFDTADGTLLNQLQLYAGGTERTMPAARQLKADANDQLLVSAGFLTTLVLDGAKLGGNRAACLLG